MKRYQFALTIAVDGVLHQAGEIATEAEIPAGCLASMLRLRQVVELPPERQAEQPTAKKKQALPARP